MTTISPRCTPAAAKALAAPHGSASGGLRLVDAAGRSEEARERARRRGGERAERRLGALHLGERGLAQHGYQREVGRASAMPKVQVAELAGERVALALQRAETVAQGLEAGVVDHGPPHLQASQRLRRL